MGARIGTVTHSTSYSVRQAPRRVADGGPRQAADGRTPRGGQADTPAGAMTQGGIHAHAMGEGAPSGRQERCINIVA
jgi:hypothetical protein